MAGSQSQGDDELEYVAVLLGFGIVLIAILWYFFGNDIKIYFLMISRDALQPPRWIGASYFFHSYVVSYGHYMGLIQNYWNHVGDLSLKQMAGIANFVAGTYYWLLAPPLALTCWYLWHFDLTQKYKGMMTLYQLAQYSKRFYPEIRPAIDYHPELRDPNADPDQGTFRRPTDYRGLAEQYNLLLNWQQNPTPWREYHSDINDPNTYDHNATGHPEEPRIPVPYPAPMLNAPRTRSVFRKQLGHEWNGPDALPTGFHKALFGILAAWMLHETEAAERALFDINKTWYENTKKGTYGANYKRAIQLADEYGNHFRVTSLTARHGYDNVVMSALLGEARNRSGPLPTSKFLWLKVVDRTLFFALNQVDRRVAWPEAAGVKSHLKTENLKGEKSNLPIVEPAVIAFADALVEESYLDPNYSLGESAKRKANHGKGKQKASKATGQSDVSQGTVNAT